MPICQLRRNTRCDEMERQSVHDAQLPYLPFTDLPSLCDPIADHPCDNAPDEKGSQWNRLMYW